jgi:hypothetical protein
MQRAFTKLLHELDDASQPVKERVRMLIALYSGIVHRGGTIYDDEYFEDHFPVTGV